MSKFCKLVREAIKDETQAPKFYNRLGKMTKDHEARVLIRKIREDEIKHQEWLKVMKSEQCKR